MDVWDEYLKESRQNYSHKDSNDIVDSMFNSGTILKKQDIDVEILEDQFNGTNKAILSKGYHDTRENS